MIRIKFQNNPYILIGSKERGGAIATEEEYKSGVINYAHLTEDGRVVRYGEVIGDVDDIEFCGLTKIQMSDEGKISLLSDMIERTINGEILP